MPSELKRRLYQFSSTINVKGREGYLVAFRHGFAERSVDQQIQNFPYPQPREALVLLLILTPSLQWTYLFFCLLLKGSPSCTFTFFAKF